MAKRFCNVADLDGRMRENVTTRPQFENCVEYYSGLGKNVVATPFIGECVHRYMKGWERDFDFRTILAYPSPECLEEYIERYKRRGDAHSSWIDDRRFDFASTFKAAQKYSKINLEKIVLKPQEFLATALTECGVYLMPDRD